ncbi:hypothetical protein J5837_01535 [Pseudoxanthomonas helianthi]|uniref:Uncharacterized protein n=1 Tax=Pseudoxanthomonas helianthi TaxID=1453541 RepID=A0A940WZW0_9GAMM|nr:hypothetical protein [Pseudoxanthomonas helianthi]MBP3983091.1 hypothetical protein [Pseudoxanthomonas helianthi]
MPDDTRMPDRIPHGWSDVFAAMPLETPQGDAWAKIAAEIRAVETARPTRRYRRPLWLAVAAAAVLAISLPLFWRPAPDTVAPAVVASNPDPAPRNAAASPPVVPSESSPRIASPGEPKAANAKAAPPDTRVAQRPAKRSGNKAARPAASTNLPDETSLAALYAQSAQLESLLAMARDERVASGTSAALSDELDAKVAGIDAALIQPGLDAQRRAELWNLRVDTLQQLVGIETTQRLYAARGQSYDVALASID